MKHSNTAQDVLKMSEERFIVAGARMMARAMHKIFSNDYYKDLCNVKSLRNSLAFFANNCPTNELELLLYGLDECVIFEKYGKAKTEYKPTKVIAQSKKDRASTGINPYDFLPEDEQRYKKLCRVLLDSLENTAQMIAVMSGRDSNDVMNQLVEGVNLRTGKHDWKVEVVKNARTNDII